MRISRCVLFSTLATGLLGLVALQSAPAGKGGGKGKPGGGDTTPPPVTYGLKLFAMPPDYEGSTVSVEEMNVDGEIVGFYPLPDGTKQPFYFNAFSNDVVVTNLNDIELDPAHGVPTGWYIYAATGINKWGDISGALALESNPAVLRGFVLELRPDPTDLTLKPRMHLIPDGFWDHTYARRINDAGEVLGRGDDMMSYIYRPPLHGTAGDANVQILPFVFDAWYAHLNNPTAQHDTQIVAWSSAIGEYVRYTLGDDAAEILNLDVRDVRGLSDTGSLCGYRKSRKNLVGYLYDGVFHDLPEVDFAQGVNASDDVVGDRYGTGPILYHKTHGAIDLETVVAASDSEQQLWINGDPGFSRITNRGVVGAGTALADFPAVAGTLRRYDTEYSYFYEGYVLIPLTTP